MQSISYEHLIDLKFGNECGIVQAFLKSEMPSLNSNIDTLMKILGTFYLISYWGFTAKNALRISTRQTRVI